MLVLGRQREHDPQRRWAPLLSWQAGCLTLHGSKRSEV